MGNDGNDGDEQQQGQASEAQLYSTLVQLEDLETLLEELEEQGRDRPDEMPYEIGADMKRLGVSDIDEVRAQIKRLHAELDAAGD